MSRKSTLLPWWWQGIVNHKGVFIATQLNSTELNSTAWTTVDSDSLCRDVIFLYTAFCLYVCIFFLFATILVNKDVYKQKHDWLGCTLFNWVSWVELSWVELSCVAINTPLVSNLMPNFRDVGLQPKTVKNWNCIYKFASNRWIPCTVLTTFGTLTGLWQVIWQITPPKAGAAEGSKN